MYLTDKDAQAMAEKVKQHIEQTMKVYTNRSQEKTVYNKNEIAGFLLFHEIELEDIEDNITVDWKEGIFWFTPKQPAESLRVTSCIKMPVDWGK